MWWNFYYIVSKLEICLYVNIRYVNLFGCNVYVVDKEFDKIINLVFVIIIFMCLECIIEKYVG